MSSDLLAALCLVVLIEGLLLFAAPTVWKRVVADLAPQPASRLRTAGGVMLILGLIGLALVRGV